MCRQYGSIHSDSPGVWVGEFKADSLLCLFTCPSGSYVEEIRYLTAVVGYFCTFSLIYLNQTSNQLLANPVYQPHYSLRSSTFGGKQTLLLLFFKLYQRIEFIYMITHMFTVYPEL